MTGPLRIGVDARELLGDTTGVGRYLGELMRRWVARQDAAQRQFILYAPEALKAFMASLESVMTTSAKAAVVRPTGKGTGTWWEQTALRRQVRTDKPHVFFAPAYTAPLRIGVPLAVTIHDVSFVAHPEWFRPREGLRRRLLTARAAATASVIFTDSEFSRGELETRLNADAGKIRVIPPGVPTQPPGRPAPDPQSPRGTPLVLFVGSLFNRRRLPDLITAFARATVDMPSARLAIVGDDRTWPPQDLPAVAKQMHVAERVDFARYVPEAELAGLYARAAVFVFLSEYEGFGLTPLEALSAGVPIVVLDTPVAREVYGDAAMYVSDVDGAAAALRRLLATPAEAARTLAHAPGVLARYSWDRAAATTLAEIERIASRP